MIFPFRRFSVGVAAEGVGAGATGAAAVGTLFCATLATACFEGLPFIAVFAFAAGATSGDAAAGATAGALGGASGVGAGAVAGASATAEGAAVSSGAGAGAGAGRLHAATTKTAQTTRAKLRERTLPRLARPVPAGFPEEPAAALVNQQTTVDGAATMSTTSARVERSFAHEPVGFIPSLPTELLDTSWIARGERFRLASPIALHVHWSMTRALAVWRERRPFRFGGSNKMRRGLSRIAFAVIMATGTLHTTTAAAQQPQSKNQSDDAKKEEARQRYQRGLQLFNEANYEAARVEFERAYQLAPSYKILYNIGLSYGQLGDYVQAQTTLQKYLEQGGAEISEERRSEVAKELAQIRPRVARVTVKTNVPGAELLVDDICGTEAVSGNVNCGVLDGTSREILINPGRRRMTLRKDGYLPETQTFSIAGSDNIDVVLTLKPLPKGYVEKKTNPYVLPMWIGWGVTAAGAITAGIAGVLTMNAADDQDAARARFGTSRQELDDAMDKTRTLATVTDVALIGTAVAAGASAYFTIRALGWKGEASEANVQVGAGNIRIGGTF